MIKGRGSHEERGGERRGEEEKRDGTVTFEAVDTP